MKVLVPVKRVIDYNVKVRVKADQTGVDLANVKMSMNPFDEIAVEEAVRLKEKGAADRGRRRLHRRRRRRRRRCAPRSRWAPTAPSWSRPRRTGRAARVAKILKAVVDAEAPGLVIMGKQAIDDDNNADRPDAGRAARLAAGTFASKVEVAGDRAKVTREVDGGLQTIEVDLPAVVTADLRLNEPRYATLPNIMKAKKKQLEEKTPADYGVDVTPRLKVVKIAEPAKRKAGVKVGSVDELVAKLKTEAGVI